AAGEGVGTDRAVAGCRTRTSRPDRDVHAGGGIAVLHLGRTVAGDGVVAAITLERVEAIVEEVRVIGIGKIAADRRIDAAGEGVGAGRGIAGSRAGAAGTDIDRHRASGVAIEHAGGAVAGDDVVATKALELVEVAVAGRDIQRTRKAIAGGVVGIGIAGALHALDVAQRV